MQDFKDHFQNVMFWLGAFIIGDHIPSLKWLTKLQGVEAKMQKLDEKLTKSFQRLLDEHAKATPNTRDSKNDDLPKDFMDGLLKMPSEDGTGPLPQRTLKPLVMVSLCTFVCHLYCSPPSSLIPIVTIKLVSVMTK